MLAFSVPQSSIAARQCSYAAGGYYSCDGEGTHSPAISPSPMREGFENTSCYGAGKPGQVCKTCQDVIRAYNNKGWTFDRRNFEQCTSCYGAGTPGQVCKTCQDVKRAYKDNGWAFDEKNFDQCKSYTLPPPKPNRRV